MELIKPPHPFEEKIKDFPYIIFLAGSIEMGMADDWQKRFAEQLKDKNVLLLDPRRDDWNSAWNQSMDNAFFKEQVAWEQKGMERANLVALYFDPHTESPISLLELGEYAKSGKLIVCCPAGFWKKGNVDFICEYNGIPKVETFEELIAAVKRKMK